MPINFEDLNLKKYEIDYENLFNELKNIQVLNDINKQWQWMDLWKENLIEHDKILMNEINTPEKKINLQLKILKNADHFKQIFVDSFLLRNKYQTFINFRIDPIINSLKKYPIQKEYIFKNKISDIVENKSKIKFTKVKGINKNYKFNSDPLILVERFLPSFNYLVIDGNHRLTQAIENNHKYIDVIIMDTNDLVALNVFVSSFDKLLFIFMNEVETIESLKRYEKIDDDELLLNSFLVTNKINWNK